MRILSAAKPGQIDRNEIRNDSNATTFTALVSSIFRAASGTVDTLRHGRHHKSATCHGRTRLTLSSCCNFLPWDRILVFITSFFFRVDGNLESPAWLSTVRTLSVPEFRSFT